MLHRLRLILFYLTVLTLLAKGSAVAAIAFYPSVTQRDNDMADAQTLIELTNSYRATLGLDPLVPNARLTQAAINKAHNMFVGQYFDHTSPDGRRFSEWIQDVHYNYFYVGENLAINFSDNQQVFEAWINSPRHRDNIIRANYQEIGIAVIHGQFHKRPTTIIVQLFGTRIGAANTSPETAMYDLGLQVGGEQAWRSSLSLSFLDEANRYLSYASMTMLVLVLLTYRPHRHPSHSIMSMASPSRYQANTPRE